MALFPIGGELLSFGDLVGSHLELNVVHVFEVNQAKPPVGWQHAIHNLAEYAEIISSLCGAAEVRDMFGSEAKAVSRPGEILLHTFAHFIHEVR